MGRPPLPSSGGESDSGGAAMIHDHTKILLAPTPWLLLALYLWGA